MNARDHVTGLASRGDLHRVLETACRGHESDAAAVICDVVGLKAINERLGFTAGDETLRLAAERLREAAAGATIMARLGGDEFVVVFSGSQARESAARAARRLLADGRPTLRSAALAAGKGESPQAFIDRLYAAMRAS